MIEVQSITFNPFQENTYILWDETGECVIIDPGCYDRSEQLQLSGFLSTKGLKPVLLLNTHCHIDHIFGNHYVADKYDLRLWIHPEDEVTLNSGVVVAENYGLSYQPSPSPTHYLHEGEKVKFGNSELDIVFTPGHSPGSVCFISKEDQFVIGGDVLFYNSIGRTDLPGGDHQTLLNSIRKNLYILDDSYKVYPGHGSATSIGFEKQTNPFTL